MFAADEPLRQVEVSGAPGIDPSRTELPEEWRALPAFLMEKEAKLTFTERRRGQAEAAPDRLILSRELWLDPDGSAFSVRDRFGGRLSGTARLDLLNPAELGRAALDGQEQLVTLGRDGAGRGLEVRRRPLALEADARLPRSSSLRAVGWSAGVEQLRAQLHLPPGWSLLGASGVDAVPGTWASRWNLLGFFFVLLVAIGVHRLFGVRPAVVALLALILTYGEAGAPFLVWLSLLGALALRRVAPGPRLQALGRLWWMASVGALVLILVPFARDQIKYALFPQVASMPPGRGVVGGTMGGTLGGVEQGRMDAARQMAEDVPAEADLERGGAGRAARRHAPSAEVARRQARGGRHAGVPCRSRSRWQAEGKVSRGSYGYEVLEQDPKAVVQTGPGIPTWRWRQYGLSWSGPVGPEHRMRLYLASPGLNRLLTLLRLGLSGVLAALLLTGGRLPRLRFAAPPAAAAMVLGLALTAPASVTAQSAVTPSSEILQDLKRRLTRPEACGSSCVDTPRLLLQIGDGEMRLSAEVHAQAEATWRVPGPLGSWVPAAVSVDGAPASVVARQADAFLFVRLSPGVHRLEARGPVPPGDSFTLELADRPRRARAEAPGWDVSGLRRDGPPDTSLQLSRRLPSGRREAEVSGAYAPWLEVTRTVSLGIAWRVTTQVRRLSPPGSPLALRVPLLPGEAPSDATLTVDAGAVAVSLGRDQMDAAWSSSLEVAEALTLTAPRGSAVVRGVARAVRRRLGLCSRRVAPGGVRGGRHAGAAAIAPGRGRR